MNKSLINSILSSSDKEILPNWTYKSPGHHLSAGNPVNDCALLLIWSNTPVRISFWPGYTSLIAKAEDRGWLINVIFPALLSPEVADKYDTTLLEASLLSPGIPF